ncbi:MAG: hypothetical protein J5755_04055, partial [Clostridia bacterium]|nr:hypothetical protein [Clostridia bacterium]
EDNLPVRFASTVLINENAQAVSLISRLLKVFGDSSIETDTFTTNISDSMQETFQGIEDNINLVYGNTAETALSLANIFNTINKNSHKDDAAYNAQSQALKEADDQKLADLMREVGRNPAFATGTGDKEGIVTELAVNTFSAGLVWGKSDEDAFFQDVNANFYIAAGHEITANALNEGYEIDNNSLDFQGLYGDNRDYDLLKTSITSKRFAALANAIYSEGIEVNGVGMAKILQVKINEDSMDLLIQVHNTQTDDTGKIMPAYLYVTSSTSLVANDLGVKDYATTCQINNLSNADTDEFIDRLNMLKSAFAFEFELTMDTITKPIQDSIQELFDDKLDPFGSIKVVDGAINLPTVFGIINERSHEHDDPAVYGYNDWSEADKDLDDRQLCAEMREVGRNPAFSTGTGDKEGVVTSLAVDTFSAGLVYGKSDENAFFHDINTNFYIADGQDITAAKLNDDFEINDDTLDFHKQYADERDYDDLHTALTNKRFAALANALYTEGINVENIGTAKILQVQISVDGTEQYIRLLVQVHNTQTDDTAKVMPEYLYITSLTNLTSKTEGVKDYATTCQINNLSNPNTGDFIDRINLLKTAFDLEFNIEMNTITKPISDNIKELFEDKMEPFGAIQVVDGAINLPTIFGIINERSHKNDTDPLGYNNWSAEDKDDDDQVLCTEMREMGRNPAFTTGSGHYEGIVTSLDVTAFNAGLIYSKEDEDAFFDAVNANFYIADGQEITAAKLNGDFEIDENTLDFHKLYADDTDYDDLHTALTNKRFAALANALYTSGITVDDIGVAKILQVQISVVGANQSIRLLVQVHVTATGDTAKVLPEYLYVTSVTSLVDADHYATTCEINDMDVVAWHGTTDFLDYRLGLIKDAFELTEMNVSTAKITDPIADNIQELFEDKLDPFGTIEIVDGAINLPTIFGIINERSHKDDTDPTGYNFWTAAAKDADDQVLCVEMREMGRNPAPTYNTGANSDIVWELDVQNFLDHQSYTHADEDAFFATVNRNFYIADGQDITAAKINDQNFAIGNDVVDFRKLYADTRAYSELTTVINNKHFAALANSLYTDGITVDDIGVAKILQVQINATSLQLLVQVHVTETGDTAKVLPEYLYVTSVTSLVKADNYATTCEINDMDYLVTDGTVDFIDTRLGLIKTAFDLEFTVSTATIVGPIADNIKELFEDKINTFGNVEIQDGQINLPTVFRFLVDGSYADKEVQDNYIMYAMDEDGYCYLEDGEVYWDVIQYRWVETDDAYLGDTSKIIFFNNNGVKHYYPEESRIERTQEARDDGHGGLVYYYPLYIPGTTTEVDADLVMRQDPEILMYSMRELGKADVVSEDPTYAYSEHIYVWKDHAPYTDVNAMYNVNLVDEDEETAFYQRLQGYYFFKNTPDSSWFDSSTNIFDDLQNNFEATFNLEAAAGTRTYSSAIPAAEQAVLEAHFTNGLYHYKDARQQVLLSDKAMGMIVNKQNVLAGAGLPSNIQSMTVTAFKIT